MNLGVEIKKVALEAGLTLVEIADKAGMQRPYLSLRVNGHRDFKISELAAIGEILGIPGWELMRRAEEAARARGPQPSVNSSGKDVA